MAADRAVEEQRGCANDGRPFQKGHSGKPGGRPRGCEDVRELAPNHTADAIDALVKIVRMGKTKRPRDGGGRLLNRGGVSRRSKLRCDGTRGWLSTRMVTSARVERAIELAGENGELLELPSLTFQ